MNVFQMLLQEQAFDLIKSNIVYDEIHDADESKKRSSENHRIDEGGSRKLMDAMRKIEKESRLATPDIGKSSAAARLVKAVMVVKSRASKCADVPKDNREDLPKGDIKYDNVPSPNVLGIGGPGRVEVTTPLNVGGPAVSLPPIGDNMLQALVQASDKVKKASKNKKKRKKHTD